MADMELVAVAQIGRAMEILLHLEQQALIIQTPQHYLLTPQPQKA
jgi:hypothetical protein